MVVCDVKLWLLACTVPFLVSIIGDKKTTYQTFTPCELSLVLPVSFGVPKEKFLGKLILAGWPWFGSVRLRFGG